MLRGVKCPYCRPHAQNAWMLSAVTIDAWIDVFNCRTGITTPMWWNSKCPLGTGRSQGSLAFTLDKVIWRIKRHFWPGSQGG